jgi:hypothetical protein
LQSLPKPQSLSPGQSSYWGIPLEEIPVNWRLHGNGSIYLLFNGNKTIAKIPVSLHHLQIDYDRL